MLYLPYHESRDGATVSAAEDSQVAPALGCASDGQVSLLDMLRVYAGWFISTMRYLERVNDSAAGRPHESGLEDHEKSALKSSFSQIKAQCEDYDLNSSSLAAEYIVFWSNTMNVGQCLENVRSFSYTLERELSQKYFFSLSRDGASLFAIDYPFGKEVYDAFPSARMDITEAAKCRAFERNNATVYHLICAAEFGLRSLAADRRVEIKNGKTPIEFAQWGDIISDLEKKTALIQQWPKGHSKSEAQQFYNDVLASARGFNDGWRTHINHARAKPYQDEDVQALMSHVRRFMHTLATRISEATQTPEIWP